MDPITFGVALGAAGAGADPLYVDDVFSTYVYQGTGSALTITNGIDLSGEGGMVWVKCRNSSSFSHQLGDTERGVNNNLSPNTDAVNYTHSGKFTAFNSDGFTIGNNGAVNNGSSQEYVSWTFRKAKGFLDIVTYSGTGSAQNISHSLGSVPGMILIKCTSHDNDWSVYHRSLGATKNCHLNNDSAVDTQTGVFNDTEPTSTQFTVNTDGDVNGSGKSYIAYIFAHDDQSYGTDSDEAIIKCGSYTGSGSSETTVNLGFEPQWVMIKGTDSVDWAMYDHMRGVPVGSGDMELRTNQNSAETDEDRISFYSQGFKLQNAAAPTNSSGQEYIYMAIRRPFKPAEAGTDVFAIDNQGTGTMPPQFHSNFVCDWALWVAFGESATYRDREVFTRLLGRRKLKANETVAQTNYTSAGWDYMDGWHDNNSSVSTTYSWMFKRAPGFFDVVPYKGTGSATTIPHNLGATPSVVLIKGTDTTFQWYWQHYALGANTWVQLNKDEVQANNGSLFNSTLPTSSVFSVGSAGGNNGSGNEYIAYLFGDLDGISKAGTYTGNGSAQDIDCGFTNGARFVMIKRADDAGDWYVWDSVRGISSGDDPYFLMNTDDAEVTSSDRIDPLNAGFRVDTTFNDLNANGGTYLYLAIA